MNILLLSKNYEKYTSGYYHQDIINSFHKKGNCFLYGEGYPKYDINDSIDDVISKSRDCFAQVDLIVVGTSWELQNPQIPQSDPHPNINLSKTVNVPKIFFLNKEYKKLDAKLEYAVKNRFDLVCTVHPDWEKWQSKTNLRFLLLPFAIDPERFKPLNITRKWDFAFTGNLHRTHLDTRFSVKKVLFKEKYLEEKSNLSYNAFYKRMIKDDLKKYKIYWAEWGAKKGIFHQSLVPRGQAYNRLLNKSKVFLNTPSAVGIINTRFFELMSTKTLILCPESEFYFDVIKDGVNCITFKKDLSDFKQKLIAAVDDEAFRNRIVEQAYKNIGLNSYDKRIDTLIDEINRVTGTNL